MEPRGSSNLKMLSCPQKKHIKMLRQYNYHIIFVMEILMLEKVVFVLKHGPGCTENYSSIWGSIKRYQIETQNSHSVPQHRDTAAWKLSAQFT